MSHYPKPILNLIEKISKLPGIGTKTAERLAMHILNSTREQNRALGSSILELKDKIRLCSECFGLSDSELCSICRDPARDKGLICIVEQSADMVALEKAGAFSGVYHILQGVLSSIDGVGPDQIRIRELFQKIEKNNIREIIIATGTSVEGESTASYIAESVREYNITATRIASGIPMGGDLKFTDQVTLKKAMEGRRSFG